MKILRTLKLRTSILSAGDLKMRFLYSNELKSITFCVWQSKPIFFLTFCSWCHSETSDLPPQFHVHYDVTDWNWKSEKGEYTAVDEAGDGGSNPALRHFWVCGKYGIVCNYPIERQWIKAHRYLTELQKIHDDLVHAWFDINLSPTSFLQFSKRIKHETARAGPNSLLACVVWGRTFTGKECKLRCHITIFI